MLHSVAKPASESFKMVHAAEGFLAALIPERTAKAVFEFDAEERFRWHYYRIHGPGFLVEYDNT